MDYLADHLAILKRAAKGELPASIDESSDMPVAAIKELIAAGLVKATDTKRLDGSQYLDTRITLAGREYLTDLDRRIADGSSKGRAKKVAIFMAGAATTAALHFLARQLSA